MTDRNRDGDVPNLDVEMKDPNEGGCCADHKVSKEGFSESHRKNFPSLIITSEQILTAAKKAKRLTSGGLQQISPWLLKRALLADTALEFATIAGQVTTRWGRGDFSTVLGELVAESQLIGL